MLSDIKLPSLFSNALVVYHVGATSAPNECNKVLLCPLLVHMSPSEAHFYPLTHDTPGHRSSAHAGYQPNPARVPRLQCHISAPTRGLAGFSRSHWRMVLDSRAWLGSGRRCMDIIQHAWGIQAWRYDRHHFLYIKSSYAWRVRIARHIHAWDFASAFGSYL